MLQRGRPAPFLFWIRLLSRVIRVCESNNKGGRYDFGFLLGVGAGASNMDARDFM